MAQSGRANRTETYTHDKEQSAEQMSDRFHPILNTQALKSLALMMLAFMVVCLYVGPKTLFPCGQTELSFVRASR